MRICTYLVFIGSLSAVSVAQENGGQIPSPQPGFKSERHANFKQEFELELCQQRLQRSKDKEQTMQAEIEERSNRNRDLVFQLSRKRNNEMLAGMVGGGIGLGFGIGAVILLSLFLKKLKLSSVRKQLLTLILGSLWIIVAALSLVSDSKLRDHPVNLLVTLFIYSLPAILFGSIMLWWLKRAKSNVA